MAPSLPAIRPAATPDVRLPVRRGRCEHHRAPKTILTATALGALALPTAAAADVTLQPDAAPAGAFTRLDVRVPTERDVATKRVVLELPPGFAFASYQPVAGWKIRMSQRELVQPLRIDGTDFDHEIARITWTAETKADAIPAGAFQDFGLAVRIPDGEPGQKLTFNALQEYADGETVRWVGDHTSAHARPAGDARQCHRPRGGSDREGHRSGRAGEGLGDGRPVAGPRHRSARRRRPRHADGLHRLGRRAQPLTLGGQVAAVDPQDLAGDEPRGVRDRKSTGADEVLGVAPAPERGAGEDRVARAARRRAAPR